MKPVSVGYDPSLLAAKRLSDTAIRPSHDMYCMDPLKLDLNDQYFRISVP